METNGIVRVNGKGEHTTYEHGKGVRPATQSEKNLHYRGRNMNAEQQLSHEAKLIRDAETVRKHREHEAER